MGFLKWHDWFAWYPIIVDNDDVTALVWFETVQRRRNNKGAWEYEIYS